MDAGWSRADGAGAGPERRADRETGRGASHPTARARLRVGLAGLYAFVGAVHLAATDAMLPLMPDWVPAPRLVILGTGLCEFAGAAGLLIPATRRAAAVGLALYAVCVYPANLKHAFAHVHVAGIPDSWWYHGPRLAFQPVFVWAALWAGGLIDWPFGPRRR